MMQTPTNHGGLVMTSRITEDSTQAVSVHEQLRRLERKADALEAILGEIEPVLVGQALMRLAAKRAREAGCEPC